MRRLRWMALVAVLAVVAAACGSTATETTTGSTTPPASTPATTAMTPDTTAAAGSADTIIIGTTDTIASLDPADAYAVHDWELIKNTSEGLLKWKPGTAELQLGLATDFPEISDDGLTYTFTLKSGVKFSDGTELTAPMYAAQLNRLLTIGPDCPNGVASALATPYVSSIDAPDDTTMVFTLTRPVAYFPQLLAGAPYVASSPATFAPDATECTLFPDAPIAGVGPYYISSYTPNEQTVLTANPNYTGELKPKTPNIIIRYFSDPQTMALAVQNGEIDVAWRILGSELISQLEDVSDLTVGTIQGGSIRYLILNYNKAPMDDINVRKAVASLVDRDELSDVVFGGQVEPLYSQVPPGFLGANEAFDTMYASPDQQEALDFLKASGYDESNKLQLELWYPPEHYGASTADWMALIKQQLEASGVIEVTLQAQEWSTYVTALTGGDAYPVGVLGWFFDYPDPSNYLEPFVLNGGLGTSVTDADNNPVNDKAQQLLDLLDQASVETDQSKRADLYGQAQDIYADLVVTLPLFFEAEHVTYTSAISGDSAQSSPDTLNIGPTIEFNYALLSKSS